MGKFEVTPTMIRYRVTETCNKDGIPDRVSIQIILLKFINVMAFLLLLNVINCRRQAKDILDIITIVVEKFIIRIYW
jgi:hypothetical protein